MRNVVNEMVMHIINEKHEERESEASLLPKYGYLVSLTKQIFGLGPPDQGNLGTNTSVSMFESSVLKLLTLYSLLLLAILTICFFSLITDHKSGPPGSAYQGFRSKNSALGWFDLKHSLNWLHMVFPSVGRVLGSVKI